MEADVGVGEATAPRVFTVTFDNNDDPWARPHLAYEATDIPKLRERHPQKSWLYVKNKNVIPIGPFYYKVTVHYTTLSELRSSEQTFDPYTSPLDQPWEIEWGHVISVEAIVVDINGTPIINSAGEGYDVTREFADLLLTVRRNEATFDYFKAHSFKDAINSDVFWGFAPEIVRCIEFRGRLARAADLFYWQVSYAFQMRKESWKLKLKDEGYRQYNETESRYEEITKTDDKGNDFKISKPWPLDGEGHALTDAQENAGVFYMREFDQFIKLPFSQLGL